jgi:hypothetical protein
MFISFILLLTVFTFSVHACTGVTQEEDEQVFIEYTCPDDVRIEEGETVTIEVVIHYDGEDEASKSDLVESLEHGYAWTAESNDGGKVKLDGRPEGTDVKVYWIGGGYQLGATWHLEHSASVDVEGSSSGSVMISVKQLLSPPLPFARLAGGSGTCSIVIE